MSWESYFQINCNMQTYCLYMIVIYGNWNTDGKKNLLDYLMSTCELMERTHEHPKYLPKRFFFPQLWDLGIII